MELEKWLPKVIAYGPTIFFILIVSLYTYLGYRRGLRKSIRFLIYSIVSLIILISLFLILSNTDIFNYKSVEIINKINGDYWLQNQLGVNKSRDNLIDILTEYILRQTDQSILNVALYSGAYIVALAQALLRLILSIVLIVIHFIFKIFIYIFYLIFNRESKRIKKINKKYSEGLEPYPYLYHRGVSSILGLVRGLLCAITLLAIVGSPLYLVYYNSSYIDNVNIESSDDTTNQAQYVLKELSKYSDTGIYKILNTVKDTNDVPYYLLITDIVMQGKIEDTNTNYNKNVYFYQELIKYRSFIDDSIDLILNYDTEGIILNDINTQNFDKIYDHLLTIFNDESFQKDFAVIINEFDKDTYLIDVAYSVLNGIVENIDSFDFGTDEVKELLKIMFKKGYKSKDIEYEKNLSSDVTLPYITVKDLIAKQDIDKVISLYFSYVKTIQEGDMNDENFVLDLISNMSQDIKEFSIMSNESDNVNKVFRRVYAYVSNKYLNSQDSENFVETCIYNTKYDKVSWVEETYTLCDSIPSLMNIYKLKLKNVDYADTDFVDLIFSLTDSDTIDDYNNVSYALKTSDILEVVINSGLVRTTLKDSLCQTYDNFAYPDSVDVKETLTIIDHLITDKSKKEAFSYITNNVLTSDTYDNYINCFNIVFDDYLKSTCSSSNLFRSITTSALMNNASAYLYFDSTILETNSNNESINRITSQDMDDFFKVSNEIFNLARPFVLNDNDYTYVDNYLSSGELSSIISASKLAEGSISKLIFTNNKFTFIRPENIEYVSTNTQESEVVKLSRAASILGLTIESINNTDYNDIYEQIRQESYENINTVFLSDVIYLNVADYIDRFDSSLLSGVIVPIDSYDKVYETYIKKDIIVSLIYDVLKIYDSTLSVDELINLFIDNKDIFISSKAKNIINATIAYKIVNDTSITSNINLSSKMESDGAEENLTNHFNATNCWYSEIYNLLSSIEEIRYVYPSLNISDSINQIKENYSVLNNKSYNDSSKTIIEILYNSYLFKYNISHELYNQLITYDVSSAILNNGYVSKYDDLIDSHILYSNDLSDLITCASVLGLNLNDSSFEFSLSSLEEYYDYNTKLYYVANSKLARILCSNKIDIELNNNNIAIPNQALESYNNEVVHIYKTLEIETLVHLVNNYDLSHIEDITVSEVLDILYDSNQIVQSYVLLNEISNEIMSVEGIIITDEEYSTSYNDSMIKGDSLYIILKSLQELGISTISENVLDNVVLESNNLYYSYQSSSIRATIAHNLVIQIEEHQYDIYVKTSNAISCKDYLGNNIYIMSASELKACTKELNKLGVTSTNAFISQDDIINYLISGNADLEASEIIQISVSKFIYSNSLVYYALSTQINLNSEYVDCINLYTYNNEVMCVYTISK